MDKNIIIHLIESTDLLIPFSINKINLYFLSTIFLGLLVMAEDEIELMVESEWSSRIGITSICAIILFSLINYFIHSRIEGSTLFFTVVEIISMIILSLRLAGYIFFMIFFIPLILVAEGQIAELLRIEFTSIIIITSAINIFWLFNIFLKSSYKEEIFLTIAFIIFVSLNLK